MQASKTTPPVQTAHVTHMSKFETAQQSIIRTMDISRKRALVAKQPRDLKFKSRVMDAAQKITTALSQKMAKGHLCCFNLAKHGLASPASPGHPDEEIFLVALADFLRPAGITLAKCHVDDCDNEQVVAVAYVF